jgi:hypothetical protein
MKNFLLTPAMKRELNVRLRDAINMHDSLTAEDYYKMIGKLTAMREGVIDYEPMDYEVQFVSREEIPGEQQYTVYFYGDIRNERAIKALLARSFNLVHNPNTLKKDCHTDSMPEMRKWKVENVSNQAVSEIFHANRALFYKFDVILIEVGKKREKKAKTENDAPKRKYTKKAKNEKQEAPKQEQPKTEETATPVQEEEIEQLPLLIGASTSNKNHYHHDPLFDNDMTCDEMFSGNPYYDPYSDYKFNY